MDRVEWRAFLELWSAEWIAAHDPERQDPLDPAVVREGWLGFAPASEAAITAAEARLGHRLPPSLREFLLVTDGWRDAGASIYRLAGPAGLDWLRDTPDRGWITAREQAADGTAAGLLGGLLDGVADGVLDEVVDGVLDGMVEGAADGTSLGTTDGTTGGTTDGTTDGGSAVEARMLARSLRVSLSGDAAVVVLDPQDVAPDGEWAAHWLASWSGSGPERFGSFGELMRAQWRTFHAVRRPPGPTRDHWDREVERGRRAALAGHVDPALRLFEQADAFGRPRAGLLRLQLDLLLGDWRHRVPGPFWNIRDWDVLLAGPLFARELLPLLARHDREARPGALRPLPRIAQCAPPPVRELIARHTVRSAEPGFRLCFGPPAFDAAVHAVVDRLAAYRDGQHHPSPPSAGRSVLSVPPPGEPLPPGARCALRDRPAAPPVRHLQAAPAPRPASHPVSHPVPLRADPGFPDALAEAAWAELLTALPLWRPVDHNHLAPVSLLAEPLLDELLTRARGRALLSVPRAAAPDRPGPR
ncbi:SMI1/KNR4 family protein [Kitasatospora sp. NPDC088391]|uniref:SMI1/KNR4 family protein n=1 Tax=Kitasatospora sp. NPDC088391 TaxID=3364074 RepID=UPI00382B08B9